MILIFCILRAFAHTECSNIRADIIFFREINPDYISPINLAPNIIVAFNRTIGRHANPLAFIGDIITTVRAR